MKLTTIKIQKQKLERWKDIQNYEGLYMISSLGRVKSLERKVRNSQGKGFRTIKEKILKLRIDSNGYLLVGLSKNGKTKQFTIHRLVAIAFIPNPENKPCIDHIDTNPSNNNVNNLRWCTQKENCNNPLSLKKYSKAMKGKYTGENHPFYGKHHTEETRKKLSEGRKGKYTEEKAPNRRKVRCIETGEVFTTVKQACEWCGLKSEANITLCCKGKRKSAGKHPVTNIPLHWTYVIEEINLDLNIFTSNINITY